MSETPFTQDGLQVVAVDVPGWATTTYLELHYVRQAPQMLNETLSYWLRFTDDIEFTYYGYDPRVRADDGSIIGTTGYPDWTGKYNPDTEEIDWERA